jgi:hypothetical protein
LVKKGQIGYPKAAARERLRRVSSTRSESTDWK